MHIHVFTIDVLPINGVISTGGGLRSLQIVRGLQANGVTVTYSVPAGSALAREQWGLMTPEERDLAFSESPGSTYLDILERVRPDAAVYLWPSVFTYPRLAKQKMVIVYDANGLQNYEMSLARSALGLKAPSFRDMTLNYVRKLSTADIIIGGSPAQGAYWSGLMSMELEESGLERIINIPYSPPELPIVAPYSAAGPTFFCTGSFLPWNSFEGHLKSLARIISEIGIGKIIVVGRANSRFDHAKRVNKDLDDLRKLPFVEIHRQIGYAQLSEMINNNGIAIDLNTRTTEREYAVPIRTVTYLAHGVPVVTNNFADLSNEIGRYGAGWQIDPTDEREFESTVRTILANPQSATLAQKSVAARRLVAERLDPKPGFAALCETIERKLKPPGSISSQSHRTLQKSGGANTAPCVLVISDDGENFLNLRIKIPFDAMYNRGVISGYHVLSGDKIVHSVGDRARIERIDAVWVQRAPTFNTFLVVDFFDNEYVYDIDDNLLISPEYRPAFSESWRARVRDFLRGAKAITCTTPRLVASLQLHSEIQIEHKTFLAPNVTDMVIPRQYSRMPEALLLASSDYLAITESRGPFFSGLRRFSQDNDLPIVYIGPNVNSFKELKGRVRSLPFVPYQEYRSFLHSGNFLAIAPLEVHAGGLTREFINCKSDIKMVEFGSAGVPAVYAKAAPYIESPIDAGPLVDTGDEAMVYESLEMVYEDAQRWSERAQQGVVSHRMAKNVAPTMWFEAISNGRLRVPRELTSILKVADELRDMQAKRMVPQDQFNADDYLAINPDVAAAVMRGDVTAYQHYVTQGFAEGRSWFPASNHDSIKDVMHKVRDNLFQRLDQISNLEERVARALSK